MKRKMVFYFAGSLVISIILSFIITDKAPAQTYPSRPIRWIVAFPPGGTTDIVARIVGKELSESLGQPVVIDNRGGVAGIMGTELAAKAKPDGYTLGVGYIATHALLPSLRSKLPYDPIKDFAPISLMASAPTLLVVTPSLPVNSLKELIALAKSKPGQLNYASPGNGTTPHLAGELFKKMAGIDVVHVPYKGSPQGMFDVMSGAVEFVFAGIAMAHPMIKAGKLKVLAVSSAQRHPLYPEIPTMAESGVAGFEMISWWGMVVQAAVPKEIISKLNSEVVKIVQMPDVKERFTKLGAIPTWSTREQFAAFIKAETEKWGIVIREFRIKDE